VTARSCFEWRGMLAMDAVGRASPEESRELAAHLETCSGCRADADEVRAASTALGSLDSVQVHRLERGFGDQEVLIRRDVLDAGVTGSSDVTPIWGAPSGPEPSGSSALAPGSGRPEADHRPARRRVSLYAAGAVVAVAALVAALFLTGSSTAPAHKSHKTVALAGEHGVTASVSLVGQTWGTRAVLHETGEAPGQDLTVVMQTASGGWWVAGSYRTGPAHHRVTVLLSCAVPVKEITSVSVTGADGHTVLSGDVG
jgi:anti-sigma factor RsiW